MEYLIAVALISACLALPMKCYMDGKVKTVCIEAHGNAEENGLNVSCTFPATPKPGGGDE